MVKQAFDSFSDADFLLVRELALKNLAEMRTSTKLEISKAWVLAVLIVQKMKTEGKNEKQN